jgi:hypothetical protein
MVKMTRRQFLYLTGSLVITAAAGTIGWRQERDFDNNTMSESLAVGTSPPTQLFGFSTGSGYGDSPDTMSQTTMDAYFAEMAAVGGQIVRMPCDESLSTVQAMVTSAHNHGLQVNLLFVNNTDPSFVQSVVSTFYPQGVIYFEGTNEPNTCPPGARCGKQHGMPPATWRTNNNAMYNAAKAVSSNIIWISGAIAPWGYYAQNTNPTSGPWDPIWYLEYALSQGPLLCDRLGFHPYAWDNHTTAAEMLATTGTWAYWGMMFNTPHNALAAFTNLGYPPPIIEATEWGAPTYVGGGQNITDQCQADLMTQGIALWKSYPWAGNLYVYTLMDMPDIPANPPTEQVYGLIRTGPAGSFSNTSEWVYKPGATAFQAAVQKFLDVGHSGIHPGPRH